MQDGRCPPLGAPATRRAALGSGLAAVAAASCAAALPAVQVHGAARSVTLAPPRPAEPFRGQYLGCQVSAVGLGNHAYRTGHAHRFRCELEGEVVAVRWYNVTDHTGEGSVGYSSGNGGRIRVQIRADRDGLPSDEVLGQSAVLPDAVTLGDYPLVAFESPVALADGRRYHVVYRQLAPREGWVSVNDLYSPAAPAQKCAWPYWEADLASIRHSDRSGWRVYEASIPIFELHYANGAIKGQGYTFGGPSPEPVDGPSRARQILRPSRTVRVGQVRLRLWRGAVGAGDLAVAFEDASGVTLAALTLPRAAFAVSAGDLDGADTIPWVTAELPSAVTLEAGGTYRAVLSAPSGAGYRVATAFKGFHENFADDKILPEGSYAEASPDGGRTWRGWSLWGSADRTDTDLPLLLTITG